VQDGVGEYRRIQMVAGEQKECTRVEEGVGEYRIVQDGVGE
jgi:hypothetical protein